MEAFIKWTSLNYGDLRLILLIFLLSLRQNEIYSVDVAKTQIKTSNIGILHDKKYYTSN
jgi:hypothetical protein